MIELPLSQRASFRYDERQWDGVRRAIEHLPEFGRALGATEERSERFGADATLTDVMRRWLEVGAASYLSHPDDRPASLKTREAAAEKVLRQVEDLRQAIVEFAQAAFGGQVLPADIGADFGRSLTDLSDMGDFFADLGSVLAPKSVVHFGCGFAPFARARMVYCRSVLDVWLRLGGKLKVSRHPLSGEVGGPLWRYFVAAASPVMRAAMISAATFPGLVADYRKALADADDTPLNEPVARIVAVR